MHLKVEIGFNELLSAIKQLPENQLAILKQELEKDQAKSGDNARLKELLLRGPVMSDEQYKEFKKTRKLIKRWRTN